MTPYILTQALAAMFLTCTAVFAAPAPPFYYLLMKQNAALAGEWGAVMVEQDGQRREVGAGNIVPMTLTIKGTSFTAWSGVPFAFSSTSNGTFTIVNIDKQVFQIDKKYTRETSNNNGTQKEEVTAKELWEVVDKDTLRICRSSGKDRPDGFTTKSDDGRIVLTFKRVKK